MSYILVALGNPGEEYIDTRHNTGRIVLEEALKKEKPEWKMDKKYNARVAKVEIAKDSVLCIEPETFMNNSGKALKTIVWNPKKAEKLIVIHDDLDLGIGSFKISFNRSAGGHNGVLSISKTLKTDGFIRIRVGISPVTASGKVKRPAGDAIEKTILGKFKPAEMEKIKSLAKDVREAIELIIQGDRPMAMTKFN